TLSSADTKTGHSRAVPILDGDMRDWLKWAHKNADGCDAVFHRDGVRIKEFRFTWRKACAAAESPWERQQGARQVRGRLAGCRQRLPAQHVVCAAYRQLELHRRAGAPLRLQVPDPERYERGVRTRLSLVERVHPREQDQQS